MKSLKIALKAWVSYPVSVYTAILYVFIAAGVSLFNTYSISLISDAIESPSVQKICMYLGVSVSAALMDFLTNCLRRYSRAGLYRHLCNDFADKVLSADVDMFTRYSCSMVITASEFMNRVCRFGFIITDLINCIISLVITMFAINRIAPMATLPIIGFYVLGLLVLRVLCKVCGNMETGIHALMRKRNQELDDTINGFVEVRSFNTAKRHSDSIHVMNRECNRDINKKGFIVGGFNATCNIFETVATVVVIICAIQMIQNGALTTTVAMSLVLYVGRVVEPLWRFSDSIDEITENLRGAEDYNMIMSYQNSVKMDGTVEFDKFNNEIKLDDVSFSYDSVTNALSHVNMTFKKGQKIGICGVSGGGKSTLFKLINRFYDVQSGSITVDGVDIRDIDIKSYRRQFGCVHQENMIFPGTIMENVKYGNFDATDCEVYDACKKASIYDFIIGLPEKFNTQVGPRGLKLSGGQKQRIALARLFLTNPDIILLDEATSALDNESETFVQDAIDNLSGKTVITIAHRLSTIRNSNVIYLMGNSGVLEQGTHEELMAMRGAYYAMNK